MVVYIISFSDIVLSLYTLLLYCRCSTQQPPNYQKCCIRIFMCKITIYGELVQCIKACSFKIFKSPTHTLFLQYIYPGGVIILLYYVLLNMLYNSDKIKRSRQQKTKVTTAFTYFKITKQSWCNLNPHRMRINSCKTFYLHTIINQCVSCWSIPLK